MPSALDHQRAAAALILGAIGEDAFALAGSGAIREHGVILRATRTSTRHGGLLKNLASVAVH